MDFNDICAQLGHNANIEITGNITLPMSLDLGTYNNVRLHGNGVLVAAPGVSPAVILRGQRQIIEGLTFWNEYGMGMRAEGAGTVHLHRVKINSLGDGLYCKTGAGLWMSSSHINGLGAAQSTSRAITMGQWDTAFITDVLIETYACGFRPGWCGVSSNITIPSITIDRSVVGMQLEPIQGGRIENLRAGLVWTSGTGGGVVPVLADASQGIVANNVIQELYGTDFTHKEVLYNAGADLIVRFQKHV